VEALMNPSLNFVATPTGDPLADLATTRETVFMFHAVDLGAGKAGNVSDFRFA